MDNQQIARRNDAPIVVPSAHTVERPETENKKSALMEALEVVGGLAIWVALGLIFGKPVWIAFAVLVVGGFICGCVREVVRALWEHFTKGKPVGLVRVNTDGK